MKSPYVPAVNIGDALPPPERKKADAADLPYGTETNLCFPHKPYPGAANPAGIERKAFSPAGSFTEHLISSRKCDKR